MGEPKKKCVRQYNDEYLKYGFIPAPGNSSVPYCLLCSREFSNEAMKPCKLLGHLTKVHPERKDKDLSYFQALRDRFSKRSTINKQFANVTAQNVDGLRASYNIAKLIAKSGKPHTIGEELILPAVAEVINTVMHQSSTDVLKKVALSNNTVQRRIDEMAASVEASLFDMLRKVKFTMQLDESTLPGKEALLLAYVRFSYAGKIVQELLFAICLTTDTKGESIFEAVVNFFEVNQIPMENISSVATDGAPSMVGRYRGFIALLRKKIPHIFAIHCVIHRQHLVARNLSSRLNETLQLVITTVNKIKSSALNSRIFEQLCGENDEDFSRLLLHTEVRWLSKGNCLTRFIQLFQSVIEFYAEKDPALAENLTHSECDIAYLTDLYAKFNEVNLQLQGDKLNMIKTKAVIAAFTTKLLTFRRNLERHEFQQFPNLAKRHEMVKDADIAEYCSHLTALHEDFGRRFGDILDLQIPGWVIDPFRFSEEEVEVDLQDEFIELKTDEELKPVFGGGYQDFWLAAQEKYPKLWRAVEHLLIAFPSSYLVEQGFSAVMNLLTKKRNRLQIAERGDLRLFLTELEPNVEELVKAHQAHPSH